MRGKPGHSAPALNRAGLIPASAGKTFSAQASGPCPSAHPRACGENLIIPDTHATYTGSSPRVRGKPGRCFASCSHERLIPACAGKTQIPSYARIAFQAHPRVCGENLAQNSPFSKATGSSPRVRGKQARNDRNRPRRGLIPACAGKTGRPGYRFLWRRAHPRVCGENSTQDKTTPVKTGSSPRVRGKPLEDLKQLHKDGLIPACAGKTSWSLQRVGA